MKCQVKGVEAISQIPEFQFLHLSKCTII